MHQNLFLHLQQRNKDGEWVSICGMWNADAAGGK